jgi:hypothetical protein
MKRMQMLVLCVLVMGAAGAIASASASASLPEYRFCVKAEPAKTGEYTEKLCATHAGTPGTGAWELESWEHGVTRTFTGKFGVSTHDDFVPESESEPWKGGSVLGVLTCKGGTSAGEITGAKSSNQTIEFSSCTSEGRACTSAGQKSGVIVSDVLKGELGYTGGGAVGTRISPAEGTTLAEYSCEGLEVTMRGSVVGVNSGNINAASKEATLTYNSNAKSGQEVVFGEFPAGAGPFYLTSFQVPPSVELLESLKTVLSNTQKGSTLEIKA